MRILLTALLLSMPVLGLDMIELKNGKLIPAESVSVRGDRLRIRLYLPGQSATAEYTVPIDQVVPEFVYYAWAEQIAAGDAEGHRALGEWARSQGLFRLALVQYRGAGAATPEFEAALREEEATWRFNEAWRLFREGEIEGARHHAQLILGEFEGSAEALRVKELLSIIAEREQFLSEQKRQEERARRARGHRRELGKQVERMDRADRMVREARLGARADARRNLSWAAYAYRSAEVRLQELLLLVEEEELRLSLRALLDGLAPRMVRSFLKLADALWISGQVEGALDAVHEVLAIEPENKSASGLRERILDRDTRASDPAPAVRVGYPYSRAYLLRRGLLVGLYPGAVPCYGIAYTFGCDR